MSTPNNKQNLIKEEMLSEYMVAGVSPTLVTSLLEHVLNMPLNNEKDAFAVLSSMSNYHWWVSLTKIGFKISCNTYPRKSQYLLTGNDQCSGTVFIPSSPRNQLLFFKMQNCEGYAKRCYDTLQHILRYDRNQHVESVISGGTVLPPPAKRRRYKARQFVASGEDLLQCLNIEEEDINMTDTNLYSKFCEELTSDGEIQMRRLSDDVCIVAMNDYSCTSGNLLPLKFVHVTANTSDHVPLVKCTCKIYSIIQGSALQNAQLEEDEEPFLSEHLTCFHCLFYKDYIHVSRFDAMSLNHSSHTISRLQEHLATLNNPIVPLGPTSPGITSKFSVFGGESCSIVHVYFTPKHCYAKCQEGLCQAILTRTKIPQKQSRSLANRDTLDLLCVHMHTVAANLEVLHSAFPQYFDFKAAVPGEPESEDEDLPERVPDPENTDDIILKQVKGPVTFNRESGLWAHTALSSYKPTLDPDDPDLVEKTLERNSYIRPDNVIGGGFFKGPNLIPPDSEWCPCGVNTWTDSEFDYKLKVFTRMGVLLCDVYKKTCVSGRCTQHYNGREEFIFLLSKETGVGQEIFWEFTTRVLKSRASFTGFCKEMSLIYKRNHKISHSFMSNKTFISSFFSWIAALAIDYRQEVDPWCLHKPKVLACDGTKIGVSLKLQKLDPPITQPNLLQKDETLHRKFDRCFLPYPQKLDSETIEAHKLRCSRVKRARKYLLHLVKCTLEGTSPPHNDQDAEHERRNFVDVCQETCQHSIFQFLVFFMQREGDAPLNQASAKLLSLFATNDDALCSVLPFRFLQDILGSCDSVLEGGDSLPHLENMKQFAVEISNLLLAAEGATQEILQLVVGFVKGLVQQVISVHSVDRPAPAPDSHEGTYNPPSGTAYYFTPHGNQVRDLPSYSIQGKDKSKDTSGCSKDYPHVPYGGFGFMFLFFCPYHGHCYGFHLIDGGEGRKDPFSAMFKFMEEPPDDLFYDFACKLQEYCLNREPDFFKSVRFWHDLFHAINHICGINFRSTRVVGLEGANSEICEQFNSYMQCVKYTGTHLSQINFMLFSQFFIYLYNKDKTASFKEIANIALAGKR